jgi:hypothetical protein
MSNASEKIIFKREFNRAGGDKNDSFFVQLEADTPSPLATVQPVAISISEAFSFATPIITVTFNDGAGTYFNMVKMETDQVYYLAMGGSKLRSTRIPLKIAKIQLKNMVGGKSSQVSFKITFVHSGWSELLNIRHNRGFTNQSYSDIVKSIASESNYKSISTAPSKGKFNAIQPHWTNLAFLKWIQERAVSAKFDDHFEYGCNINGDFFFSTISDMVYQQKSSIMSGDIPTLRLGSYAENEVKRSKDLTENFNVPNFFTDFNATEHYMDTAINGGGGVISMAWDFEKGQFIQEDLKQSNMSMLMMSDVSSLKTVHETSNLRVFCGNDVANSGAIGKAVVSSVSTSGQQFQITTDGSININIGQVVELIILNDKTLYKSPYSMLHSGFFIIASVTHMVVLGDTNKFTSTISLSRSGINGKDLKGYVKTKGGKL